MPEGTGNSKSEHGSVGKGNGTDAKGNKSDGSKGGNVNDTKYGGLGGWGGSSLGGTKKAGNATVADHMIFGGQINVPSIGPNGMAQGKYPSQDDAGTAFAKAIGDYATRGWLGRALDWAGGPFFDQQEPISQNPRTFADGTYHTSTNPAGALAALGSMAAGVTIPGLPSLIGQGYNFLGGKNVFHGGYSQPDTGAYSDPSGGWGGVAGAPGYGGNPGNASGNNGNHANNGLLTPTTAPATQPVLAPQAQPAAQQANQIKQQGWALGLNGVPGPTPYNYQTAWWL